MKGWPFLSYQQHASFAGSWLLAAAAAGADAAAALAVAVDIVVDPLLLLPPVQLHVVVHTTAQ